jgi:hypothetical protein
MNSRRLTQSIAFLPSRRDRRRPTKSSGSLYRTLSLPPSDLQVLWADLNCPESAYRRSDPYRWPRSLHVGCGVISGRGWDRMDIHPPRCLNMGGDIIVEERS